MRRAHKNINKFLGSKLFFYLTLLLCFLQSGWVALSARYPMAFDESYHLGIIRLYAKQWSPFFAQQPPGPATFSTLTRDPSYIHHYLMSFPYRLVSSLTDSLKVQVVTLRFIDIVLVLIGLVIFRKVLLKTKASKAVVNVALLFFVMIPIMPLLSGQINYDNLMFPLTAVTLLYTINFIQRLKDHNEIDLGSLTKVLVVGMLTCLVKFTFLPIFTAVVVYLLFILWRYKRQNPDKLRKAVKLAWDKTGTAKRLLGITAILIGIGLFLYTYGVNIAVYKNPIPQCHMVLPVERCSTYRPWARNYAAAQVNQGVDPNPIPFMASWFYGMFNRLFFVVNSDGPPRSNDNHIAPIVAITGAVFGLFAVYLIIRYGRGVLKKDPILIFLLFTCFAYWLALVGRNYHDYLQLGQIVAINGRYLLAILLPVYVFVLLCYREFFKSHLLFRNIFFTLVFVLFLEGGGVTSYLFYSNSAWYWQNDRFVNETSQRIKRVINPLFISNQKIPYFIHAKEKVYEMLGKAPS